MNCTVYIVCDIIHVTYLYLMQFNPGDTVCVLNDVSIVRRLQEGHGVWSDEMSKVCYELTYDII